MLTTPRSRHFQETCITTRRKSCTDNTTARNVNMPCKWGQILTGCAPGDKICLRPLQVDNIVVFIRQVASVPAGWLFKTSTTSWPFDLENGVQVTSDVGYRCANFSLPRPLCSRLRPDVPNRQTSDRQMSDVRQKHLWGGGIKLFVTLQAKPRHTVLCRLTIDTEDDS